MEELGYNRNDIKILYKMNKKAEIIVDTTVSQTESISVKEIVKQGSIFGPIMCCTTTSRMKWNEMKSYFFQYKQCTIYNTTTG